MTGSSRINPNRNCLFWCDTGASDASFNMALDETLLNHAIQKRRITPLIHCYGWKTPAVSFGCFQPYSQLQFFIDQNAPDHDVEQYHVVRRPTGGGWVWHQNDVTFSIIIPLSGFFQDHSYAQSYEKIHAICMQALLIKGVSLYMHDEVTKVRGAELNDRSSNACFSRPVSSDVMMGKKKILGGAQLRRRGYLLYQGTFQTGNLVSDGTCNTKDGVVPLKWTEIINAFSRAFSIEDTVKIDAEDHVDSQALSGLLEKYRSESWTKKYMGNI